MTRRVNGKEICTLCGDEIDLPKGKKAQTTIAGSSGKRNVRILKVETREIHRCEMSEAEGDAHAQMS